MDIFVTVPLSFGWQAWIDEGDPAGAPWSANGVQDICLMGPCPSRRTTFRGLYAAHEVTDGPVDRTGEEESS